MSIYFNNRLDKFTADKKNGYRKYFNKVHISNISIQISKNTKKYFRPNVDSYVLSFSGRWIFFAKYFLLE